MSSEAGMKIALDQREGWDIVTVRGPMMMTQLTHVPPIFSVLGAKSRAKVALDLAETVAMDSGALSVLITLKKELAAVDGRLAIVSPSEEIRVLFGIVGFDEDLEVYDTRNDFESAIRA